MKWDEGYASMEKTKNSEKADNIDISDII